MNPGRIVLSLIVGTLLMALQSYVYAQDAYLQADEAVADILFDYDNSSDFATYSVNERGFVSITFASNMPDELYSELLGRLKNHEGISGVLAGKSGPPCRA